MEDIGPPDHVRPYYPKARWSSFYIELFLLYAKVLHGAKEEQVAFLASICSDDLNSVSMPKTDMIGPFNQGGLDGYPFSGITGLGAFSHHIPDCGVALMLFGPHVGITDDQQVGMVVRPGQGKATTCCGAAAAALKALEEGTIAPLEPHCYPVNDYQQERIRQTVLEHQEEIKAAGDEASAGRFIAMSEIIYRKSKEAFVLQVEATPFEHPAYYFGGILINQDGRRKSLIALRDAAKVEHGVYTDLTQDFEGFAEKRFDAYKAGDKEAFRSL
ncbi:hypothetical protein [Paludisphaera mucosa]|uniref:Limiting CO2-inducible protein B/C beta carbonyic anhydrase domain-containing protein n=1 Tax=Paludisphaera mucosa TaxID=3030827 RepID=A0ABT6F9R7_9BACT|nr:hypothetical protein [Paludisphaera mucosa]MDG3004295.1 hypothetical protein [Paludisphaera mucosa]